MAIKEIINLKPRYEEIKTARPANASKDAERKIIEFRERKFAHAALGTLNDFMKEIAV